MADFTKAHYFTAKWEGGISDDPQDRGGFTAFGVCTMFMKDFIKKPGNAAFLESLGLTGVVNRAFMKKIDARRAAKIFRREFWDPFCLSAYAQAPATVIYDAGVNCGAKTSLRIFQQAINNVLPKGKTRLVVDGLHGPKTHQAILDYGEKAAYGAIELRKARYRNIVKSRPGQNVFLRGWLNRADDLAQYIKRA